MPNLTKQFNNAAVESVSVFGGGGNSTNVAVQLEMVQRKYLTGVYASVVPSVGVGAVVPVVFSRLIVVTGNMNFENGTNNVVGGPIVPRAANYPANVARVLLDLDFNGLLDLDFNEPMVVEADEILTGIVGVSIVYQNGTVAFDPAMTRLILKGHTGDKENQDFPYRLR